MPPFSADQVRRLEKADGTVQSATSTTTARCSSSPCLRETACYFTARIAPSPLNLPPNLTQFLQQVQQITGDAKVTLWLTA